MKKILKIALALIITPILAVFLYDAYNRHFNYNFGVVTEGKVYKSGAIKPSEIKDYVEKYKIKTIIDLRSEDTDYSSESEKAAIDKIDGVKYVHIRSPQVPKEENLKDFFEVLDNEENYPVQIHCYHGLGRTMLYVALYRIEYENWSNEDARAQTRPLYPVESFLYKSTFAKGKKKGDFLINYKPRESKNAK